MAPVNHSDSHGRPAWAVLLVTAVTAVAPYGDRLSHMAKVEGVSIEGEVWITFGIGRFGDSNLCF